LPKKPGKYLQLGLTFWGRLPYKNERGLRDKRYQDTVLCAWLENVLASKRYQF